MACCFNSGRSDVFGVTRCAGFEKDRDLLEAGQRTTRHARYSTSLALGCLRATDTWSTKD